MAVVGVRSYRDVVSAFEELKLAMDVRLGELYAELDVPLDGEAARINGLLVQAADDLTALITLGPPAEEVPLTKPSR